MTLVVHYDLELHQIGVKIVIDDVGAYIQKHALDVHQVQHMIDVGDNQDNNVN